MNHPQASGASQGIIPDPADLTITGLSFRRASILFVASVSSLIGASLFLASI